MSLEAEEDSTRLRPEIQADKNVLIKIDFKKLLSVAETVRGFGLEVSIIIVVVLTAFSAHSDTFTTVLTSYGNTSDAFKVVSADHDVNRKLMSIAQLSGNDKKSLPKMLSMASASEPMVLGENTSKQAEESGSGIITAGSGSAIIKPAYAVPPGLEGEDGIGVYKVAEGDTPVTIASRFGVSVATVLIENNLHENSVIKPGQELRILSTDGITYTVKEGDTLNTLAEKFKITEDEILDANLRETDEGFLLAGANITIPKGDLQIPQDPEKAQQRMRIVSNRAGQIDLTTAAASNISSASGKLIWPTDSRAITQYFSYRHDGLDISGGGKNPGPNIYAADDGFIEIAGWLSGGWGNNVMINHGNGIKTRYAHMSIINVKAGQKVGKGQKIGNIGNTGRSTGPHLHYMIYVNGKPVNPLLYARP